MLCTRPKHIENSKQVLIIGRGKPWEAPSTPTLTLRLGGRQWGPHRQVQRALASEAAISGQTRRPASVLDLEREILLRGGVFQGLLRTKDGFFPQTLTYTLENSHYKNPYSTDRYIDFQLHFNLRSIPHWPEMLVQNMNSALFANSEVCECVCACVHT